MAVQKKLYTADEFERYADLPENSDRLLELIDGEIAEKAPTQEHGMIGAKTAARLLMFVEPRNLGRVGVEIRHRVPADVRNARMPDVSFTSDITSPIVKKGSVPQMPDLAIEIKSPDDSLQELRDQAAYYLANGSRMVWLIFPDTRTVEVHMPGKEPQTLGIDETLDGDDVLPSFRLPVRDIFPE